MENIKKELKDRVRELIEENEMTQQEFADYVGTIKRSHVASIVNGKSLASPRVIKAIAETCGVNELWLEKGEGEKYAPEPELDEFSYLMTTFNPEKDEFKTTVITHMLKLDDDGWNAIKILMDQFKK